MKYIKSYNESVNSFYHEITWSEKHELQWNIEDYHNFSKSECSWEASNSNKMTLEENITFLKSLGITENKDISL